MDAPLPENEYKLIERLSDSCGKYWNGRLDSPFFIEIIKAETLISCPRFSLLPIFLAMSSKIFHENLLKIQNIIYKVEDNTFFFVYENEWYLLENFIEMSVFRDEQKNFILYNILITLDYLHKYKLAVCNLCPHNILISDVCNIKLKGLHNLEIITDILQDGTNLYEENQPQEADSWSVAQETDYSLNYLAPEIIFGASPTCACDLWSFGVILYELTTEKRLFNNSNKNDMIGSLLNFFEIQTDQLSLIKNVSEKTMRTIESISQLKVSSVANTKTMLMKSIKDKKLRDVISGLLVISPSQRLSTQDLLKLSIFRSWNTEKESEYEEMEFWQTLKDKKDAKDKKEKRDSKKENETKIAIQKMDSDALLDNLNRVFEHDGNKHDFFLGLSRISFSQFTNYYFEKIGAASITRPLFTSTIFDFLCLPNIDTKTNGHFQK
jgi:serine/threonine protein kinase